MRKTTYSLLLLIFTFTFLFTIVLASTASTTYNKTVLLTFDDGPDPKYTPHVLDILAENNIKGIFFVVGRACKEHPEILKRIAEEGHTIGNHTYSHKIVKGIDRQLIIDEIHETEKVISQLTGYSTNYFRPPTGAISKKETAILNELGYSVLMWDFGLEKTSLNSPEEMVDKLRSRIGKRKQVILLLHDGNPHNRHDRSKTVTALPTLIEELQEQGFEFIDPSSIKGKELTTDYSKKHPGYFSFQAIASVKF